MGLFDFLKKQAATATIEPAGRTLTVAPGEKLLTAALAAGLDWPHDCRVGSCGTCRCVLRAGQIKPLSDFIYTLEREDIEAGAILACQSLLKSDVVVEVELGGGSGSATEHHRGVISAVTPLTHDIVEVVVKTESPCFANARAGQYAEITAAGIALPRSYSFARSPRLEAPDEVSFFIRHVPGGEFTDWLFGGSRVGAAIELSGPFGNFHQRDGDGPVICVAGGSGLAPIRALIEDGAAGAAARDLYVYFGARTAADLYALDELAELGGRWGGRFELVPVLSEEPAASAWGGGRGLVTDALMRCEAATSGAQAYLCGPPAMVDAALPVLARLGVPAGAVFHDKFEDASTRPRVADSN